MFKGDRTDTQRFLEYFTVWAKNQAAPFNGGNPTAPDHKAWIVAALSLMDAKAAQWATPFVRQANEADATHPFPFKDGDWKEFVKAYKARFISSDEQADARESMRQLSQGKQSVPEYAALFQEVAD